MNLSRTFRPANLNRGLVSVWLLGENTGNRADSVGTNTLTPSGSPTSGTGILGGCMSCASASTQFCHMASNSTVQFTNAASGFTFAIWANPTTIGLAGLINKEDSATTREYRWVLQADGSYTFQVSNNGTSIQASAATAAGVATTGNWNLVIAGYDPIAGKIFCKCDNRAPTLTTWTSGLANTAALFRIGQNKQNNWLWNGKLGPAFLWNRTLTPREMNQLLRSGVGRTLVGGSMYG